LKIMSEVVPAYKLKIMSEVRGCTWQLNKKLTLFTSQIEYEEKPFLTLSSVPMRGNERRACYVIVSRVA
jgi:hypothetical protein